MVVATAATLPVAGSVNVAVNGTGWTDDTFALESKLAG